MFVLGIGPAHRFGRARSRALLLVFLGLLLGVAFCLPSQAHAIATFSSKTPAPGSTVSSLSGVTVIAVTSPNQIAQSIPRGFFLDGVARPVQGSYITQWSEMIHGYVTSADIPDGPHTVRMYTTELLGLRTETSWSFTLQAPPTLTEPLPADGSVTPYSQPAIGLTLFDNTPGPVHLQLAVDGALVFDGQAEQGPWTWVPTTPFANNSSHNVVVSVTDGANNFSTLAWSFTVVAGGPMETTCLECHTSFPATHPMDNCEGCHGYGSYHGEGWAPTYAGACLGCHEPYEYHAPDMLTWCDGCHTPDSPLVPMHDAQDIVVSHTTTAVGCEGCHDESLVAEHAKYPLDSVFKYQCHTCHDSADPAVSSAIATSNTDCVACHELSAHPHPDADTALLANGQRACSGCHSADVVVEHAKTTSSSTGNVCQTCHVADGPRSQAGDWDATCTDAGCHADGSDRAVHETYCLGCHEVGNLGFASPATEVDFAASTVDKSKCDSCHWVRDHFAHGSNKEGCTCHTFSYPAVRDLYVSSVSTPFGYFTDAASPDTSASRLHDIHVGGSWPQGVTKTMAGLAACKSCHAPASCTACHADAAPAHGSHGSSDPQNAAVTYRVASGAAPTTPRGADTTAESASGCVSASCHATVKADTGSTTNKVNHTAAVTAGSVQRTTDFTTLRSTGSKATFTISGQGDLTLYAYEYTYGAIARVTVDGGVPVLVDTFAQNGLYNMPAVVAHDLAAGTHTVVVENTGTRNPLATGARVNVMSVRMATPGTDAGFTPRCPECHADKVANHTP